MNAVQIITFKLCDQTEFECNIVCSILFWNKMEYYNLIFDAFCLLRLALTTLKKQSYFILIFAFFLPNYKSTTILIQINYFTL